MTKTHVQQMLFDAAAMGRTDMVAPLLAAGADIDAYDERGFTPLILAAYDGHLDTVNALLDHKANACKPDVSQGNTAQMGVAFKGEDQIAARLLQAGCDVNARNRQGQTALMMASMFDRKAQVDMLIAAGARRDLADTSGRTASSVARDQGNDAMADHVRNSGQP
ncbi:ankyrin repeat domain-containing protein [Sphingobium sp. LB126]|uniref:ankyrin repeat domain-containing protein n=1 Tax=Sphingobium sp. LB126 TaxID=1983755 RepID=UPI001F5BD723|nr:ankyrin repeat domain-containing protein [Sphingobium sp. LB126]